MASGPQAETPECWASVAAKEVHSRGGLFFGLPDDCPWVRTVLTGLAGRFRGTGHIVECSPADDHRNARALAIGRSPHPGGSEEAFGEG